MKVLVITNLYPLPWEPNRGVFNKHQFAWLERSNDLKIVVLVSWLDALKNRSQLKNNSAGNKVSYLPYFYTPKVLRALYPLFILFSLLLNFRAYKRFNPDRLLCSWAFPDAVAGTWLAKFLRVPAVIKVHGSDVNEYLKFPLRRTQIIWAASQASAVVAVSNALKQCLVANGAEENRIKVVYNGVDKAIFREMDYTAVCSELGVSPDRKRILFVGNLKRDKGCVELLEAFKAVAPRDADCDLIFIGKGACHEIISNEAGTLGEGRVKLLGVLPQQQIVKWMNASRVVALPSKNEGVPNVLLEAMSCGVQVVASNVGGVAEVVDPRAGQIYEWGDRERLVECLMNAVRQRGQSPVIAETAARFTWERNETEMNKILQSIG